MNDDTSGGTIDLRGRKRVEHFAENMTIREFAAIQIMAAFATSDRRQDVHVAEDYEIRSLAERATAWADAIISKLNPIPDPE